MPMQHQPGGNYLLLYDGDCNLCTQLAQKIDSIGSEKLQVTSLQAFAQKQGIEDISELKREVHLISPSGQVFTGAEAAEEVVALIPAARPIRWMFKRLKLAVPTYQLMRAARNWCRSCS